MALIVFAHGAGAGPESAFMQAVSGHLRTLGHQVECITFPYWQQVLATGKKRPPDRQPLLDEAFKQEVAALQGRAHGQPLVVMGKSMGARVAFRCAHAVGACAAIGLGFPFHPPSKPAQHRLSDVVNPCKLNLIIQGTRDPFGKPEWLAEHKLPENLQMRWFELADHDFKVLKRAGISQDKAWQLLAGTVHEFIETHINIG